MTDEEKVEAIIKESLENISIEEIKKDEISKILRESIKLSLEDYHVQSLLEEWDHVCVEIDEYDSTMIGIAVLPNNKLDQCFCGEKITIKDGVVSII